MRGFAIWELFVNKDFHSLTEGFFRVRLILDVSYVWNIKNGSRRCEEMRKEQRFQIKKVVTGLLVGTLMLSALCACEKEEVTLVSETAESGQTFQVEYEQFLNEDFNLIFADAQDGSYMQSMEVLERPGDWSWQEVLIQCGNANVEEFVLAGMSFYEWKTIELGNAQMEYLSVEEEQTVYSVGVLALQGANYGVMLYGNFGEEILLKTAQEIEMDENQFEFQFSGIIQNISLSNRGKSLESYKVQFFEKEAQVKAYLKQMESSITMKQLKEGRQISVGESSAVAVGYGLDAEGKIFFAGQGQGMVTSLGLIELTNGKGFLLLEYTNRSREDKVETLPARFETLGRFF